MVARWQEALASTAAAEVRWLLLQAEPFAEEEAIAQPLARKDEGGTAILHRHVPCSVGGSLREAERGGGNDVSTLVQARAERHYADVLDVARANVNRAIQGDSLRVTAPAQHS